MATIPKKRRKDPFKLTKFEGLWLEDTGDTQIPVGASGNMTNFYPTKLKKLKKTEGYKRLFDSIGAFRINALWNGNIQGVNTTLFISNSNLYKLDLTDNTYVSVGSVTDADATIFGFEDKAYIINGSEYKVYDGSTLQDVVDTAYIPLTFTAQTPNRSSSTALENINLLTGAKRERFISDGTTTIYQLAETNIDSVDFVRYLIGGSLPAWNVDLVKGQIIFTSPPTSSLIDDIEIEYTKGSGAPEDVYKNKYATIYGQSNDTRVFLFGNEDQKDSLTYSGLADGVATATYFPALSFIQVGSQNTPVMDMVVSNTRFVIYKEDRAYIGYYQYSPTVGTPEFPTSPLDYMVTKAYAQTQVVNSVPLSIGNKILSLVGTNVRDERNIEPISDRIQNDLDNLDMSKAVTVDWESKQWYLMAIDDKVYIYDYEIGTFARLHIAHNVTKFIEIDRELYFGTDDGMIMKFDEDELTFDGEVINAHWEMNFEDFGASWVKKSIRELWISLFPKNKSRIDVSLTLSSNSPSTIRTIRYENLDFENVDFSDFSFSTSYNPQPFRVRIKGKKFAYMKVELDNNYEKDATILEITLPINYGGKIK